MTPEFCIEVPFVTLQAEEPSGPCHLLLHLPVVLHFYVKMSLDILQDERPTGLLSVSERVRASA